jgi:hypothetical protein
MALIRNSVRNRNILWRRPIRQANLRQSWSQIPSCVYRGVLFVLRVLQDAWPRAFGRRPHEAEDPFELIRIRSPGEESTAHVHLPHDAPPQTTCRYLYYMLLIRAGRPGLYTTA